MPTPSRRALEVCAGDSDHEILARLVFGEARGWPPSDDHAVAFTVLNRLRRPKRFGVTIKDVCLARGQYSCFGDGRHLDAVLFPEDAEPLAWQSALAVAHDVLGGHAADPTGGATHYVAKWLYDSPRCPKWARGAKVTAAVLGSHVFLRGVR